MTHRSLATLVSLLLAAGLSAQSVDPAQFTAAESTILAQRGALTQSLAIDSLLADLAELSKTAGDPRIAALAEYEALLLARLAQGFSDPRRIANEMERLATRPLARAHPVFCDVLRLIQVRAEHARGAFDKRDALRTDLGILTAWWILGALDNERGSGYAAVLPPEQEFVADRAYPGKKQEVQWRPLNIAPAIGYVDLSALLRPTQQVMAYAATCLTSETEQTVVLRLGSSQAFKVFLNSEFLTGRDLRRRFEYDQDSVVLPLQVGRNFLLLKICNQEGRFGFAARLRRVDGKPVSGITVQADADSLTAASKRAARKLTEPPVPNLGARTLFTEQPADAYRLGSVLTFYHGEDDRSSRIEDLLRSAVEGLPDQPASRYGLAASRVRLGRSSAQREDNPRRHDYLAILAKHPGHTASLVALSRMDLASTKATGQARERLRAALAAQPSNRALHAVHAELLSELELENLAHRAWLRANATDAQGNFYTRSRRVIARHHLAEGRLRAARDAFESLVARGNALSDFMELAQLMLRMGERDKAIEVLAAAQRHRPFSRIPARRLSRLWEAEGDTAGAMARIRWILELCPEDDGIWTDMAYLYGLVGQHDRQREALRTAVQLAPNRKSVRRQLEFLESETKPFYNGFECDAAAILAADRGPAEDASTANDPYYALLDQRVVHAYRNGTTSEYRHRIVRILNAEGSRLFANFRVPHYWREQRARLLQVKVHRGEEILRPRLRGSRVSLPPLRPGDAVEIRYRVDDTAPSFFGDYFGLEHLFASNTPTRRAKLVVILDKGREYRLQTTNGAPTPTRRVDGEGRQVWEFEVLDLERADPEERQPSRMESAPLVRITTYQSWGAFTSWWWNLIRNQSSISPQMRKKAEQLTEGLTNNRAKIDAIYRFVTTDIRYEAWEFGVHGYKPYSTPVIFERRHGDCKDKSLLLNALLSVVGIRSHPVLIRANPVRSKDDLELAMVNHFNHCISYVDPTDSSPGMYLDGTANYHPIGTLPTMDYGAEVLVVRGTAGDLEQIAWPPADTNVDEEDIEIRVLPNGDAKVTYRTRPTRNRAVGLRAFLGNEKAKQGENIERILQRDYGEVVIENFETSDLLDLNAPVRLQVEFIARHLAKRQGQDLLIASSIGNSSLSQLTLLETRRTPLLLGTPRSERQTIRYRLPTNHRPLDLPPATSIRSEFGSFSLRWRMDRGVLIVERRLELMRNRIPTGEYRAFRAFTNQVDQASRKLVVVQKQQGTGK